MSTVERTYKMTRIEAGDYLLPSNDAKTMWRLCSYTELGDVEIGGRRLRGTFWNVWRWEGVWTIDALADSLELNDWTRWEHWAGPLRSRGEAVEEALRARS